MELNLYMGLSVIFFFNLDSAYKQYHIFFFLSLAYFN